MKAIFLSVVLSCIAVVGYTQDSCGVQNLQVWGTGGGAWLRQSFTPVQSISDPVVSIPCFFVIPTMMNMSLYQGSVWDENPVLVASSDIWNDSGNVQYSQAVWYSISVPGQILNGGQQYFIEIKDVDIITPVTIFGFGTTGTEDLFVGGEERDPLTPYEGVGYWFPDLAISVQGNCLPCPGDFNEDGMVGVADLTIFIGSFGCTFGCNEDLDIDGDTVIGIGDLVVFVSLFGQACP